MTTPGLRGCADCGHEWFHVLPGVFQFTNGDTGEVTEGKAQPALCFADDGKVAGWGGQLRCVVCGKDIPPGELPPTPTPKPARLELVTEEP